MNQEQAIINVLKGLVIDGVHFAKSGHPGGPLSSMDFAYTLFHDHLRFDPDDPKWMGRDRFILSAGHESMLLYSFLYMIGWLEINDLKKFRQLHSKTPGHPENTRTLGVECTTGPLGQGCAMSVGFSIAGLHYQKVLAEKLFQQKIFVLAGDGDMQEDVTLASASYAGHLKLNNLIWYYDKNDCQISGKISRTVSDDFQKIYEGFGWDVIHVDGHDRKNISVILKDLRQKQDRPTLIIGKSVMAQGTFSMENSHHTHGAPLPNDERLKTKEKWGMPKDQDFYAPAEIISSFRKCFDEKNKWVSEWKNNFNSLIKNNSSLEKKWQEYFGKFDANTLPKIKWDTTKAVASRNAFGDILEKWSEGCPKIVGGSADLEPSNMTDAFAKKVGDFNSENRDGRNFAFGVREFPMSAICNGMALFGGLIPFDATFLSFSDYSRPALRLGAIQNVGVIHEFTHDSFYLGEDGPTHQPVEHVMSLRLIPNFYLMRPADAIETESYMRIAMGLKFPSAICLSRQKLPFLDRSAMADINNISKGAYTLKKCDNPKITFLATGSEVSLAISVAHEIEKRGWAKEIQIVSMPCWEIFEEQSQEYKASVIKKDCPLFVSIEAGRTLGWQKYTGNNGINIGIDHFGESAPMEALAECFGFTVEKVLEQIRTKF